MLQSTPGRVRSLLASFTLLLGCLVAVLATDAMTSPASASDDYPYANAKCEWTESAAGACRNYDWYWDENGDGHFTGTNCDASSPSGECFDPWGYQYRNCTSWVASKLSSLGVPASRFTAMGNGNTWGTRAAAHGVTNNSTPAVGAVAVSTAGDFGHVALITGYNASTGQVTVEEYNKGANGMWGTRTGTLSGLGFSSVDHYEAFETSSGPTPSGRSDVAVNGGFESGSGPWVPYPGTNTNYVDYRSGQVSGESALSALHYGATNTSSAGGGIYQDVPLSAAAGEVYCASAWVRTQYPATGGSGQFVVWLLGGSYNENGAVSFSGLSNGTGWREVHTCVSASTPHSSMRIQLYPTNGGPTIDIDNVDVHKSIAANGGFESGSGPWVPYPGTNTNYVDYRSGQVSGESALSALHYGATNTSSAGGGIYQDVPLSAAAGEVYCASAWVRTQYPATGGSGQFVVWLLGGSYNENGAVSFSGLSNGTGWREVHTCVSASTPHSSMRIQLYPTNGGPTIDIDNVDVHKSIAANGGFESGSGPWVPYPGTNTNYVDYRSGQVSGESALSALHYGATNTSSAGGGIYQDVPLSAAPGEVYCASAWVRTQYPATGGSGQFVVWLLGGSYNENGAVSFSGLSNGTGWREVHTCVSASTPHSSMRIQLYPTNGGPTIDIDNVDVH